MPELTLSLALRLTACFFFGAIPFAVLSMVGSGVDVRTIGSGNPGFNNVLRHSKLRAVFCLIGDFGKGVAAVLLFPRPADGAEAVWLFAFAIMLGHCYSPFLGFEGGKGIATSAGVMLVLFTKLAVVCLLVYAAARIIGAKRKWREAGAMASLGSWVLFAVLLLLIEGAQQALFAAVMLALVTWRHKDNLRRLAGPARS